MRFLTPFTFTAFFLSGITALVYELTWVRLLKHVFGSDSLALSTMLTVFIGGIALGTYISGKFINAYFKFDFNLDRETKHALNLAQTYFLAFIYGVIELVLGFYAFFVPLLLGPKVLGSIWSVFAGFSLENLVIGSLIKFILSSLLLIIPTVLMGLSFPILTELLAIHKGKQDEVDQFAASNLYATNTFGAIVGALLGGFYFLPQFGLNTSVNVAAGLNIFIAILVAAWFYFNRVIFEGADPLKVWNFIKSVANRIKTGGLYGSSADQESEGSERYRQISLVLLLIAFTIGFINLSLEVIWTKILTLIIGSSTYSLTLILIAVLAGISLGAYLLNAAIALIHLLRIDYLKFLKISLSLFAILVALSSSLFNKLPWLFLKLSNLSQELWAGDGLLWFINNIMKFVVVSMIAMPVTIVEGLIFAFILYLISSETNLIPAQAREPVGTRVARASYINTSGAIIGSFVTGFMLIPLLSKFGSGVFYSLIFIIILAYLLSILPYSIYEAGTKLWGVLIILVLMLVSVWFMPRLNTQEISSGVAVYRGLKFKSISKAKYKRAIDEKILYHKEGVNAIVTVTENPLANSILLKTNGKVEASRPIKSEDPSKADMLTQILLGEVPALLKPAADKALLIGMGSGISLNSLAKVARVKPLSKLKAIDVCEIEANVYEAADKFFDARKGVIGLGRSYNNHGVEIKRHVVDARNFLQALNPLDETVPNYDIIISQPSDPWISGTLFTQEFWQLAANNLSDAGIFVQWLQLYSIDPEYLTIALRTFQSVFPEVMVFRSGRAAELILVGSRSSIEIDIATINEKLQNRVIKKELASIGINSSEDILANLILVPNLVRELLASQDPTRTDFKFSKNIKVVKYISNIDEDQSLHKPKLTKENLQDDKEQYVRAVEEFKGRTSTDDNMLLEFHTSRKLNEFYATVSANEIFLAKYINPDEIIRFFAESNDRSLIMRLAMAHNRMTGVLHKKLAQGLAEAINAINKSPASYLTLYQIYMSRNEDEKAESILYESKSRFADLILPSKRSKLVLFEGLLGEAKLDAFELSSLAQLYALNQDWSKARKLIDRAIKAEEDNSDLYRVKAEILFSKLQSVIALSLRARRSNPIAENKKAFAAVSDYYQRSLAKNEFNYTSHLGLADYYVYKSNYVKESERQALINAAINHCIKAIKTYPNAWSSHMHLANLYLSMLPDSQLGLLKTSDELVKQTVRYLQNTLLLNPHSLEANYEMANLQYKFGNIDLAYKHIRRLMKHCAIGSRCVDTLGADRLEQARELNQKLKTIVKGEELAKHKS